MISPRPDRPVAAPSSERRATDADAGADAGAAADAGGDVDPGADADVESGAATAAPSPTPTAEIPIAECGLRERKKRQARVAMHRAALELVAEHGLDGVTVEMIAERAGVSPRTFFNHWATKETAILGVAVQSPEDFLRHLLVVDPAASPEQALRGVLREMIRSSETEADVRELKKEVMRREPQLHAVSAGRTVHLQSALVTAFELRICEGAMTGEQVDALIARRAEERGAEGCPAPATGPATDTDPSTAMASETASTAAEGADGSVGQEHSRAVIAVQLGFAITRSAFSLSMVRGTTVLEELDRILDLMDAGEVRI